MFVPIIICNVKSWERVPSEVEHIVDFDGLQHNLNFIKLTKCKMGHFLKMMAGDPLLQQEKQRLFDEMQIALNQFIERGMRVFVQRMREKHPAFANDDSVIYHACLRVVREMQTLKCMMEPSNHNEETTIWSIYSSYDNLHGNPTIAFDSFLLNVFGGNPPLMSDSLAKASEALQAVVSSTGKYSPDKSSRVRFYLVTDRVTYNMDAKDKGLLEPHAEILSVAFGVGIHKHQSHREWMHQRGLARKNKN